MFEKYAAYGFEDFVQDAHFVAWVKNPDVQSDRFWNDFQETFPYQRPAVRRARQVVEGLIAASRPGVPPGDADEIWARVQQSVASGEKSPKWWQRPWLKVAAAVLLLAGIGSLFFIHPNDSSGPGLITSLFPAGTNGTTLHSGLSEITNRTARPRRVVLPDSSRVTLQPAGTLRYHKEQFTGATRNVELLGEAFFEVTRDLERPFLVHSNGLVTKVLGTSFNIKARKGSDHITVTVRTGKVAVFAVSDNSREDPESRGLILRANQQVDYSRKIEKFTRTLVPDPVPVLPTEEMQQFVFNNAPVADIFGALEKVYDTEILFDAELLSDCHLTSTLDAREGLFEKLDVLCEAIDASYKVVDAQIVISGKRCR